jgi:dihydrofolate synthase/folylpolyglutamate synthase
MVQHPEALEVIKRVADEQKSSLSIIEVPWGDETGLAGPHQRWNAAMAVAALRAAGLNIGEDAITRGLREVQWPGRFQKVGHLIIDGAHNLDASTVLAQTWREQFGAQKTEVIFGAVSGKDTAAVLRELAPIASAWHFTAFESPRALPAESLGEIWHSLGLESRPVTTHERIADALQAANAQGHVLIAGSLYLAGEALALLENKPEAFERSAQ